MKKRIRKIALFMFVLFSIFIVTTTSSYALTTKSNNDFKIVSENIPGGLKEYAIKELPKHIQNIQMEAEQYGFKGYDVQNFKLAEPFSVYSEENGSVYYFPVTNNSKIIALLGVSKTSGEGYTSTFEKGFADKLQTMVENEHSAFRIVNDNNELRAVNNIKSVLLAKTYTEANKGQSKKAHFNNYNLESNVNKAQESVINSKEITTPLNEYTTSNSNNYEQLTQDSNSLQIKIVLQGSHPWCWAATCAGIINYEKGTNLDAAEVVRYVYGSEVEEGGNWNHMKKAYNNWGLYPNQTDPIAYDQVKTTIDGGHPIHLGMMSYGAGGHSMTLRGYTENSDGTKSYSLIDPNKDYFVSVSAKSDSSNVYYILNGYRFYWYSSRLGF
ncbi:papain-like cysteine protease family protein [Clostridium ihumii]|uniref:papain-like cysteine protease family protein n=1 Tax=Clostridium ihumii TaxID=1470356 RepID=UPI00058FF20B|nr:papain-like cysteine protease family protein [Clostridium ihumii]